MKAFRTMFAAMAVALFILPATASAQSIFVGGGVTFPTGDFKDGTTSGTTSIPGADTGWMGVAGVTFDIMDNGLWVYGEGSYGQNGTDGSDDWKVYGAMGGVGYEFDAGESFGIYIFGGAGLLASKIDESESKFGYEGGAGVDIPLGDSFGLWVEGRYMGSSDVNLFGILGGIGIDLGGGDGM